MTKPILNYESQKSQRPHPRCQRRPHTVFGRLSLLVPLILGVIPCVCGILQPSPVLWVLGIAMAIPIVAIIEATERQKRIMLPLLALGLNVLVVVGYLLVAVVAIGLHSGLG